MAAEQAIDQTEDAGTPARREPARLRGDDTRALRRGVTMVLTVVLAVLAVLFVYTVMTPLPRPSAEVAVRAGDAPVADLTVFSRFDPFKGNAPDPEIAPVEVATETTLNLKLYGTFLGERPSAIVQGSDNRQGVYFVGDEIAPGVRVREIRPDQILLDRRGAVESLTLQNRDVIAARPTASGTRPSTGTAPAAPVFNQLSEYLRIQPDPAGAGFRLYAGRQRDAFEGTGLRDGDRLLSINGSPLSASGRELAALPERLTKGPLIVIVERDGTPMELEIELTGLDQE